MQEVKKKIVMAGSPSVGKTSMVRRFVLDAFDDDYVSTLGTKVSLKTIELDSARLVAQVWDIGGQPELLGVQKAAFSDADGALIVADLSRPETIVKLRYWVARVTRIAGSIPFILIGNKTDLEADDEGVSAHRLEHMARRYDVSCLLTSVKDNIGVDDAFHHLATETIERPTGPELEIPDEDLGQLDQIDPVLQAADAIIMSFCAALNDLQLGMSIVRREFDAAEIDFRSPSRSKLEEVIARLETASPDLMNQSSKDQFRWETRQILNCLPTSSQPTEF